MSIVGGIWNLIIVYQTKPSISLYKVTLEDGSVIYSCDVDDDIVLFETPDRQGAMDRVSDIARAITGVYGEIPFYLGAEADKKESE